METGTLKELKVKPGDVVERISDGEVDTVVSVDMNCVSLILGRCVKCEFANGGVGIFGDEKFRIISRALDGTPDLTTVKMDAIE